MHEPANAARVAYNYYQSDHPGTSADKNPWHGLLHSEHELWLRLSTTSRAAASRTGKITLPGFPCVPPAPLSFFLPAG